MVKALALASSYSALGCRIDLNLDSPLDVFSRRTLSVWLRHHGTRLLSYH